MKKLIAIALILASTPALADSVRGYVRKDGTYVQPHQRSAPDSNPYNNYSTQGNTNPYTGQKGYEPTQPAFGAPSYQQRRKSGSEPFGGFGDDD